MNGYSKLRLLNKKSRSVDFSDLLIANTTTFPDHDHQTEKTHDESSSPNHSCKTGAHEEINIINEHDIDGHDDDEAAASSYSLKKTDMIVGGMPSSKKNTSVSSPTSSHGHGVTLERSPTTKTTSSSSAPKIMGFQSALKRAFSLRTSSSSSVSYDNYCRIHDQCVAILLETTTPFDDDDNEDLIVETKEDNDINPTSVHTMRSMESGTGRSRGRILKACKRLLGFY